MCEHGRVGVHVSMGWWVCMCEHERVGVHV